MPYSLKTGRSLLDVTITPAEEEYSGGRNSGTGLKARVPDKSETMRSI
jgi:hypothetical protein